MFAKYVSQHIYKYHYSLSEPFSQRLKKHILHTDTLWTYTTSEMGLPGFICKSQGQTKVKKQNISLFQFIIY